MKVKKTFEILIKEFTELFEESEDGIVIMKSEIKRMLDELDNGVNSYDERIKVLYSNYTEKINKFTEQQYNETIESIKQTIKKELEQLDIQLTNKFDNFNNTIDNLIELSHKNELSNMRHDLNVIMEEFKNVTNLNTILKNVSDLIGIEFSKFKENGFNLTENFKKEIKNISTLLKDELKLIVTNAKSKLKLFISEFEKIVLMVTQ